MELGIAVGVLGLFAVVGVYYFLVRTKKTETPHETQQ
jgi:hypothetical protein